MEPTLQEKLKTVAVFCGAEAYAGIEGPDFTTWCVKGAIVKDWRMKYHKMPNGPDSMLLGSLYFHTDYNWLMEAWAKWKTLDKPNDLRKGYVFENYCSIIGTAILDQPLEKAFNELASAIVWYNSLNK